MNRHHPYPASYDPPARSRGGSPNGPGPDRSYRQHDRASAGAPFRGRGGYNNRGRGGGYGSYDGAPMSNAYDPNPQSSQPYTDYEVQPSGPGNSYFQHSGGYGEPSPYPSMPYDGYDKYEDVPPVQAPGYDNDYNRRPQRPQRRERDDKVHESIIEERIQRERPCRTLFIRNIKYETPSEDVRALFEEHGEIKTFFDLISTRGMVFVTYFDLRAAERARERLQGSEISGRPIDVHYSLPRDDAKGGERERNQQFQGTLQVTLRNSPSGNVIDDNEVRRKFQQFGDVKSVRPVQERIDSRYVEYYDTRACDEAYDRLRQQPLQDGLMDIVFAWDNSEGANGFHGQGGRDKGWDDRDRSGHRGRGRGRGRGGKQQHQQHQRGGYEDDYERHGPNGYGRDRGGRYEDDYGRGGPGRGGSNGAGYGDRYNDRGGYNAPPPASYPPPVPGPPPPMPPPYGAPQPPPSSLSQAPPDDRLDQARKVQQLLAALKQPTNGASGTATPPTLAPPPLRAGLPPAPAPYYPQPPAGMPPYSGSLPPASAYTGAPPAVPTPPPAAGAAGISGLPPNIMALLAQAQQRPGGGPPPPPSVGAPYGMPLPPSNGYSQMPPYLAQGPK